MHIHNQYIYIYIYIYNDIQIMISRMNSATKWREKLEM
jgi:hypothetical protein